MNQESQPSRWSLPTRIAVSFALLVYLLVMVWAPLSTPIGAPFLTTPVEEVFAPAQNALYLRHGYRFFGPDPGPTHSLVYEIQRADGSKTMGHFPDRQNITPRLLYHRWFMLSETLYREASQAPTDSEISAVMDRYDAQIAELQRVGKTPQSQQLIAQREIEMAKIQHATARCQSMLKATARVLLKRTENTSDQATIRLWIQTRGQPRAEESLAGMSLTDPLLISRVEVGFYQAADLLPPSTESASDSPTAPTDPPTPENDPEAITPIEDTPEVSS